MDVHFFYVPYRLLWSHWEQFNGAQDTPGVIVDYTIPIFSNAGTVGVGSLGDYMGLPIGLTTATTEVSALPFRAYFMIFNAWYRDENLVSRAVYTAFPGGDGPDNGVIVNYVAEAC